MIGIDLVHVPEFARQLQNGGQTFLARAFNNSELKDESAEHLAGLWAAKEAIFKAADKQPKTFTAIKIHEAENGKPTGELDGVFYHISIAHHGEYADAVAQKGEHV